MATVDDSEVSDDVEQGFRTAFTSACRCTRGELEGKGRVVGAFSLLFLLPPIVFLGLHSLLLGKCCDCLLPFWLCCSCRQRGSGVDYSIVHISVGPPSEKGSCCQL